MFKPKISGQFQVEKSNFEDSLRKSKAVFQYICNRCDRDWWGTVKNNTCNRCKSTVNKLPLEMMTGN